MPTTKKATKPKPKPKPKVPEFAAVLAAQRDVLSHLREAGHDGSQAHEVEGDSEKHCCQCWAVQRLQDSLTDFEARALARL